MSKFLESIVRSEGKSCEGKIKYPNEESAQRNAVAMVKKKGNDEVFESYKCAFCDGWHIGHRTNFDWIPKSHASYTLILNHYYCECKAGFLTSTVISNRILTRFKKMLLGPESDVRCPYCKAVDSSWLSFRRRVPLSEIAEDSTQTLSLLFDLYPDGEESGTDIW